MLVLSTTEKLVRDISVGDLLDLVSLHINDGICMVDQNRAFLVLICTEDRVRPLLEIIENDRLPTNER